MSGSAYDVHPYMLINYNGKYTDMSTVAHELGHAMHSFHSNRAQPFHLAGYQTFVAEVASQFNEDLLLEYILKQVKEKDARIAILGNYLETLKATVFRQTQFADFELQVHQLAQQGKPLTGDSMAKLYLDITKKYYGHDQGVCIVDDYIAHEWSGVPHFYSSYYVFQYATSFTAATALSEGVLTTGAPRRRRDEALHSVSVGRRVEAPNRSAQGRRRRHDDRPAARADSPKDESGDGRNREAAWELETKN